MSRWYLSTVVMDMSRGGIQVVVVGALLFCSAACRNGKDAPNPDTASGEDDADDAAVGVCGGESPEVSEWSVEILYDLPALGPERKGRSRGVEGMFVDGDDVLLYGDNNFAHLRTDGTILATVPYPPHPANDQPLVMHSVAKGNSTVGGLFLPDARFCIFDSSGAIAADACVTSPQPFATRTIFAGQTYWNLLGGSESMLWPVSEAGTAGEPQRLGIAGVSSFDIVANTVVLGIVTFGAECTVQVSTAILGNGVARPPDGVLSPSCASTGRVETRSFGEDTLVIYQGGLRNPNLPLECAVVPPTASFGVVVNAGGVSEVHEYGPHLAGTNRIYVDPPYFLALTDTDVALQLLWISTSGELVGRATALDLGETGNTDGPASVAPLGADEYLIGYGVVGAESGTRIRRIRVTRPSP